MYLEFNQLTLSSFKTFVKAPVTLALTHPNPGLRFIRGRNDKEPDLGSNGAAKSSLFAALTWCLYGQTVDGLKTSDVVPWETELTPTVSVTAFADNKKLVITRRGNKLLLNKLESSQDEITNLISLPFEVFKHTVLLGQGEDLFFDLTPREKMDILASALNLDRWEARSEKAGDKAKKVGLEVDGLAADIREVIAEHLQTKNFLKQVEEQTAQWSDERAAIQKERNTQIGKLKTELDKQQKLEATAELALDSAETELVALNKRRATVHNKLAEAKLALGKEELRIEGLEDAVKTLQEELRGLTGQGDVCPTCGQTLKGTTLATHKKRLQTEIQGLQARIKVGVPVKVAHPAKTLALELAEVDRHRAAFQGKADNARSALKLYKVPQLQTEIRGLEKQQATVGEEVNPYREQATGLRKQLKTLNQQLEDLQADLADAEQELARLKFWVSGFKEVRLDLLEEFLQELEMATNAMLPESGLHDWAVRYDVERETKKGTVVAGLNVTVLSPHNTKPVKWKSWSGGEKHRLRVVGALALAEVLLSHAGVQTNLEILDEPTRDLSTEGVQDLFAYLAIRAKQLDKDIFTIDHMAVESRHFAEVITVVKNADGSFIES